MGLIWVLPKIGVPQNGWFIMGIPIKMDDLGVPLFSETSIKRKPLEGSHHTWICVFFGECLLKVLGSITMKPTTILGEYFLEPFPGI